MANLSLNYSNLMDDVGYLVGWGLSSGFSSNQEAIAGRIINDGYAHFLDAHQWSFLEPRATFTTTAPYSTGTVGITAGVVTLSGGVFPSWAGQGRLSIQGGTYEVDAYDSSSQVTLVDTSVTVGSGAAYSLERLTYDLPTDFGGWGPGPLVNETESFVGQRDVERVSEAAIRRMWDYGSHTSYPRYAAHLYKEVVDNNSNRYQQQVVEIWPPADRAYVLSYTYSRNPSGLDDTTNTIPLGGPRYHQAVRCAVMAEAEQKVLDGGNGLWMQRYFTELQRAIDYDRFARAPRTYGKMKNTADQKTTDYESWERPISPGTVYTYPS